MVSLQTFESERRFRLYADFSQSCEKSPGLRTNNLLGEDFLKHSRLLRINYHNTTCF